MKGRFKVYIYLMYIIVALLLVTAATNYNTPETKTIESDVDENY